MKSTSVQSFNWSRYALAVLAGLLLAFSFPKLGIAGFAWVAPALMLTAAIGMPPGERFRIGYVAAFTHYLFSLYWILLIPVTGFPIAGWLALSAFLAFFPAAWVWLIAAGPRPRRAAGGELRVADALSELASAPWSARASWAFTGAAAWVAMEMTLARVLGGFPWNLVGDSQFRIVPLIQIASVTGVYGVSFLVVWGSISLLCGAAVIIGKPALRSGWVGEIILPFAAVFAVFAVGFHQLTRKPETGRELRITLIQPSIPQTLIWNPENDWERFQELLRMSDTALHHDQSDLLIWPEAATPGLPRIQKDVRDPILALAREHHVWIILGADDVEVTPGATNYFNASFLVSPEGKLAATYHKQSLVMFGEYIPLEHVLPFVKWFTPVTGSYAAGKGPVEFDLSNLKVKISVLICFEDVFPGLARRSVGPDTDLLVNITNDGWFGKSAAQWQQAAAASFRAVENGVPLVRCANTGLTCWIDAHGRIRETFADEDRSVYGKGFMTVNVPLPSAGAPRSRTFYNLHGDVFGWSCVGLAVAMIAFKRSWR